jgi:hypothetical protein
MGQDTSHFIYNEFLDSLGRDLSNEPDQPDLPEEPITRTNQSGNNNDDISCSNPHGSSRIIKVQRLPRTGGLGTPVEVIWGHTLTDIQRVGMCLIECYIGRRLNVLAVDTEGSDNTITRDGSENSMIDNCNEKYRSAVVSLDEVSKNNPYLTQLYLRSCGLIEHSSWRGQRYVEDNNLSPYPALLCFPEHSGPLVKIWLTDHVRAPGAKESMLADDISRVSGVSVSGLNKTIYGNNNQICGSNHIIVGHSNNICGTRHHIKGNYNTISGCGHTIIGTDNTVVGSGHTLNGSYLSEKPKAPTTTMTTTVHAFPARSSKAATFTQVNNGSGKSYQSQTMNFGNFGMGDQFDPKGTFVNSVSYGKTVVQRFGSDGSVEQWMDGVHTIDGIPVENNTVARAATAMTLHPKPVIDLTKEELGPFIREEDLKFDEPLEAGSNAQHCVICMERARKCIMKKCNHYSLCLRCAFDMVEKYKSERKAGQEWDLKCPMCRKTTTSIEIVY